MKKENYIKNNVYYINEITEEEFVNIFRDMLKEDSYYHTMYIFGHEYYYGFKKFLEKLSDEEQNGIKFLSHSDEIVCSYFKYQIIFGKFNLVEKRFHELHYLLVDEIVKFCRKENLNTVDEVYLSIDCLRPSLKEGQWMGGTDSSLTLFDENKKCLMESI